MDGQTGADMERIIACTLVIAVWVYKDKEISALLFGLREKKLDLYCEILTEYNIDKIHRKRYKQLSQARFLLIPMLIVSDDVLLFILNVLSLIVLYKIEYYKIKFKVNKRIRHIRYQFPIYLRQLQVLLQNNTVTKAIEASLDQVPNLFKEDIVLLHKRLLENPMNLNAYIECMSQYDLPEIQRAMKWLYRYQTIGISDVNRQFNRMITSTSKWLRQSRIQSKEQSLTLYQWWGILPLFGVTIVFLSAMVSVATSFFERR